MFVWYCCVTVSYSSPWPVDINLYFYLQMVIHLWRSCLSLSWKSFLISINSVFLIISYISFSNAFKYSFCGSAAEFLKAKLVNRLLSSWPFSLQKWYAFHQSLLIKHSTFSTMHFKYLDGIGIFLVRNHSYSLPY